IAPEILKAERDRVVTESEPPNLGSYNQFIRGLEHHYRYTQGDNTKAQQYFRRAIELDPRNAQAYAALAHAILHAVQHGWREDDEHNYQTADSLAIQAVRLDGRAPFSRFAYASTSMFLGRTEQALEEMEYATTLN